MPARHIPPRHRYLSGRVASTKVPHAQAFESSLEQDFLLILEFDRGVNRFASQPITIRWKVDNRQRRYTPDVLVEYLAIRQREREGFAARHEGAHLGQCVQSLGM